MIPRRSLIFVSLNHPHLTVKIWLLVTRDHWYWRTKHLPANPVSAYTKGKFCPCFAYIWTFYFFSRRKSPWQNQFAKSKLVVCPRKDVKCFLPNLYDLNLIYILTLYICLTWSEMIIDWKWKVIIYYVFITEF